MDGRGDRARARGRARAGASPKSGPEELKVAEPSLLRVLSLCMMALLGIESLSGLLEIVEPCERFFQ